MACTYFLTFFIFLFLFFLFLFITFNGGILLRILGVRFKVLFLLPKLFYLDVFCLTHSDFFVLFSKL